MPISVADSEKKKNKHTYSKVDKNERANASMVYSTSEGGRMRTASLKM